MKPAAAPNPTDSSTAQLASPPGKPTAPVPASLSPPPSSQSLTSPLPANYSLTDHHNQRLRLLDALKLQARRAEQLLGPQPGAGAGAPGLGQGQGQGQGHHGQHGVGAAMGVTEERLKKADKWTLAVRVRDLRGLKDELGVREGEGELVEVGGGGGASGVPGGR